MKNGHKPLHSSRTKDYVKRVILVDCLWSKYYPWWGTPSPAAKLNFLEKGGKKENKSDKEDCFEHRTPKQNMGGHSSCLHKCPDCVALAVLLWGWGRCPSMWRGWEGWTTLVDLGMQAEDGGSALLLPQTPFVPGSGARCLFRLISSSAWWKCLPTATKRFPAKFINIGEGAVGGAWSSKCSELTVASSLVKLFCLSFFEN